MIKNCQMIYRFYWRNISRVLTHRWHPTSLTTPVRGGLSVCPGGLRATNSYPGVTCRKMYLFINVYFSSCV